MLVERKDGWYVVSRKGKNLGGPYTYEKAKERLRAVEMFKLNEAYKKDHPKSGGFLKGKKK